MLCCVSIEYQISSRPVNVLDLLESGISFITLSSKVDMLGSY